MHISADRSEPGCVFSTDPWKSRPIRAAFKLILRVTAFGTKEPKVSNVELIWRTIDAPPLIPSRWGEINCTEEKKTQQTLLSVFASARRPEREPIRNTVSPAAGGQSGARLRSPSGSSRVSQAWSTLPASGAKSLPADVLSPDGSSPGWICIHTEQNKHKRRKNHQTPSAFRAALSEQTTSGQMTPVSYQG